MSNHMRRGFTPCGTNVPQSIQPSARRITAEQPMETYFQQVLSLQPQTADGWRTILPLPKTMSSQWGFLFLTARWV